MKGQSLKVSLPGTAYQRRERWWWRVRLPGEDRVRARALKPPGQRAATRDRATAAKVAFGLWEQAVRREVEQQVRQGTDDRVARLKAKFLQKMQDVSQVVDRLSVAGGSEVREKGQRRATTAGPSIGADATGCCGCCGSCDVPVAQLRVIDSGQSLCPTCLAQFKAAARASRSRETKGAAREAAQAACW